MKYFSKSNITIISTFSKLMLIVVTIVLCNFSIAEYKTRVTVDTIELKITPYQPVDEVVEETTEDNIQNQEENINI